MCSSYNTVRYRSIEAVVAFSDSSVVAEAQAIERYSRRSIALTAQVSSAAISTDQLLFLSCSRPPCSGAIGAMILPIYTSSSTIVEPAVDFALRARAETELSWDKPSDSQHSIHLSNEVECFTTIITTPHLE